MKSYLISNSEFPTGWIIGGGVLLAVGGLLTVLIYKTKKTKKQLQKYAKTK